MLRVDATVEIARSPEEVFAFASDVEKLPLWLNAVIEANQITEGPLAEGTELEHVLSFLGKRFTVRYETTQHEAARRLAFRSISGPIEMQTTIMYEPVPGGTRIDQVVTGDTRGFFRVAEPLLVKLGQRQLQGSLENLKDLLETDTASV